MFEDCLAQRVVGWAKLSGDHLRGGLQRIMDRITKIDQNFGALLRLQRPHIGQLLPRTSQLAETFHQLTKTIDQLGWGSAILESPFYRLNPLVFQARDVFNANLGMIDAQLRQLAQVQKNVLCTFDFAFLNTLKALPVERISRSLAAVQFFADGLQLPVRVWRQTMGAVEDYQAFAGKQLQKITAVSGREIRERLMVITDAAGEHLEYLQGLAAEVSQTWEDSGAGADEEPEPDTELSSNFFLSLNRHLAWAYRSDTNVRAEEAVGRSLPGKIFRAGLQIGQLVIRINQIAKGQIGEDLFKPTTRNMEAMLVLPTVIAWSGPVFAHVIDYLYFLLYEGSGEARRLLQFTNGGDIDLEPMWQLKHLRRMFRHDLDHGKPTEVRKKLLESGAALMSLVGDKWPEKPVHWKSAQLAIYIRLIGMLEGIMKGVLERKIPQ